MFRCIYVSVYLYTCIHYTYADVSSRAMTTVIGQTILPCPYAFDASEPRHAYPSRAYLCASSWLIIKLDKRSRARQGGGMQELGERSSNTPVLFPCCITEWKLGTNDAHFARTLDSRFSISVMASCTCISARGWV